MRDWISVKDKLPPANMIVRVKLTNGCFGFDFVNEPFDPECPFQHYIVESWRECNREELIDILKAARELVK